MTEFEFQIIALILVAFIIGVVIGYFLRTRVFPQGTEAGERQGITLESRQERPSHALLRGGAAKSKSSSKTDAVKKTQPPSEKNGAKREKTREEKPAPPAKKASVAPDNLQQIKGIGAVLEKKLNAMGIERFEQIANWTDGDIAEVDEQLNFRGRIQREKWVEQAQELAKRQDT